MSMNFTYCHLISTENNLKLKIILVYMDTSVICTFSEATFRLKFVV